MHFQIVLLHWIICAVIAVLAVVAYVILAHLAFPPMYDPRIDDFVCRHPRYHRCCDWINQHIPVVHIVVFAAISAALIWDNPFDLNFTVRLS